MTKNNSRRLSLILGLGETGMSCAQFLSERGHQLIVADTRVTPPALERLRETLPGTEARLGAFDPRLLDGVDQVVVSPGLSIREPIVREAQERGIPVCGDIELFSRVVAAPVIAITGSNGKSTVTTLIARMLECAGCGVRAGGNLGPPALDLLSGSVPDFYVLELSSFQLETTDSLRPAAAVVLNVSPDHIDRHGDLDDYAAAKARIYRGCGTAIVNRDDPVAVCMAEHVEQRRSFGLDTPPSGEYGVISIKDESWMMRGAEPLMPMSELRLTGRHNVANVLAAIALGEAVGVSFAAMSPALREFEGLPHRMQCVAELSGIRWINDSKATNVGATVAALTGLDTPVVLIAGGDGKGADFLPMRDVVRKRVRVAVLLGRDGPRLAEALSSCCEIRWAADIADAVRQAREVAYEGDTVLLSPACASLDMFDDYTARGQAFAQAVKRSVA